MVMKKQASMKGGGGCGGGGGQEPRSSSSCAACKFLKRRCTQNCLFAPYFRSDEPKKFAKVHKVFGASNVSKILIEVAEEQREDTVNSLVYEAEARLRDPVYGCIGAIALLQKRMVELQNDLEIAKTRLANHYAKPPSSSSCQAPMIIHNNSLYDDNDDDVLDHGHGGDHHQHQSSSSLPVDEIAGWNGLGEIFGGNLLGFNQGGPLDEFFNVPFP